MGLGDDHQKACLQAAYAGADLTLEELWMRYFALGGEAGLVEVDAYLHGLMPLPTMQRDLLAVAVNERLDELPTPPRVPYSRTVAEPKPDRGPLAALVQLLEGSHLAPPERLAQIVTAAGRALDLSVTVYLIDYEQRRLVPLPERDAPDRADLEIDTTLAGRAFRLVESLSSDAEGPVRLWVPLIDGVERLGVLELEFGASADQRDPELWRQIRWFAMLLAQIVTLDAQYGDGLDRVRRTRSRTVAAELLWTLLPPLSAGTDKVMVAGMLQPSYDVGGDAFDYVLSETTATLAVFDAMGHALDAGLIAAAALASYRNARREGRSLEGRAQAIDETIAASFGDSAFVTGILAELDLDTGRLCYLVAGHPSPLVLRSGKVVKSLTGGRRTPFGVGSDAITVADESLQPGDWLVLYTDGITEARDDAGRFFGTERLVDFLEREAASGHPPPETVRRLTQAVMDYQHSALHDDATVFVARWDNSSLTVEPP